MSTVHIRPATPADLPEVEAIENRCFSACRRSSRRALIYSLKSPAQSVWVATVPQDGKRVTAGAMILHHHRLSLRIFSVAVLPAFRGCGAGRRLLQRALRIARKSGRCTVSLEADRRNRVLTRWYESFGFETVRVLEDYYSPGRHAVRMHLSLKPALKGGRVRGCS